MAGQAPAWPASDDDLIRVQHRLAADAAAALAADPWRPPATPVVGGCYVAFGRGGQGPGGAGDEGWAAAVSWRVGPGVPAGPRRVDAHLRGAVATAGPRVADDTVAQSVVTGRAGAAYVPGLLARREGPLLAAAVAALNSAPDVLLVDATGPDHPRRAGLAIHLGAVTGIPTVGVTHRALVASGAPPADPDRGARTPVVLDGEVVGYWVRTRTGARPLLAHAGWRTNAETAADVVLASSTEGSRTPVPLQEARRVAREARALGGRR